MTTKDDLLERRKPIQENVVNALEKVNFHGRVDLPFRVGKSHIGVKVIDRCHELQAPHDRSSFRSLWVTDQEMLRDVDVPEVFNIEGKNNLLNQTKIVCYQSLNKVKGHFDTVILDEYQNVTSRNTEGFFNGNITYNSIVAMSATPPKHWSKRNILEKLGLYRIVYMNIEDAIGSKIISDYKVHVVKFGLDDKNLKFTNKSGQNISEKTKYENLDYVIERFKAEDKDATYLYQTRMRLLYGSSAREDLIKSLVNSKLLKNKRGLVFVPYKKIANDLGPHYHSSSGEEDYLRFKDFEIDQLILVKSGGVGHTYEGIEYIVIGQPTRDFNGITSQNLGRGLMYKEGEPVDMYILCCQDTVEERWVKGALNTLNPEKIEYYNYRDGVIYKEPISVIKCDPNIKL